MDSEGLRLLREHVNQKGARATSRDVGMSPATIGLVAHGKTRPSDQLKAKLAAIGIDPSTWDIPPTASAYRPPAVRGQRVGEGALAVVPVRVAPPPPPPEPLPAEEPDDGTMPDAQELARLQLRKVKRYAAEAERTGSAADRLKYLAAERAAIDQLAKLSGQSATNEAQLAGSPAWLKLRDLILAALSEHPDAARAVLGVLDEALP